MLPPEHTPDGLAFAEAGFEGYVVKFAEFVDHGDVVLLQLVVADTLKLYVVLLVKPVTVVFVPLVLPEVTTVPDVVLTSQLYVTVGLPAGVPDDQLKSAVVVPVVNAVRPTGVPGVTHAGEPVILISSTLQ